MVSEPPPGSEVRESDGCGGCRFYRLGPSGTNGECHRHAPRPRATYRCDHDEMETNPAAWWPEVGKNDWCGEYAARGP